MIGRKTTGRVKATLWPLYSTQIPYELLWHCDWDSVVTSQWLQSDIVWWCSS